MILWTPTARSSYDWKCVALCPLRSIWSSTSRAGLLSSSTYTLTTYVKVPMPWIAGKEKRNEIVHFGWMVCVCVYPGLVSFFGYHHLTLDPWTWWDWWEKHQKASISSFTALVASLMQPTILLTDSPSGKRWDRWVGTLNASTDRGCGHGMVLQMPHVVIVH